MAGTRLEDLPEVTNPTGTEEMFISVAGVGKKVSIQSILNQVPPPPAIPTNLGHFVAAPASSSSPGNVGDFSADAGFIYVCYAPNTWRRSVATTF